MTRFTLHTDPGHGWIEVPLLIVRDLRIPKKISAYSYKDARNAYLEEDCDAALFVEAFMLKHGRPPNLDHAYSENSFIRNLHPYQS